MDSERLEFGNLGWKTCRGLVIWGFLGKICRGLGLRDVALTFLRGLGFQISLETRVASWRLELGCRGSGLSAL